MNSETIPFSVKCDSEISVLEIGLHDFSEKVPRDMMELLKKVALQKQIQRLLRMKEISQTVKDIKERESLHKFHVQTLKALIKLHPNASKNII